MDLANFSRKSTEKLGHIILILALQKVNISAKNQGKKMIRLVAYCKASEKKAEANFVSASWIHRGLNKVPKDKNK